MKLFGRIEKADYIVIVGCGWLVHSTFSTTADIYSHLDFHAQMDCLMGIRKSLIEQRLRHIRFLHKQKKRPQKRA